MNMQAEFLKITRIFVDHDLVETGRGTLYLAKSAIQDMRPIDEGGATLMRLKETGDFIRAAETIDQILTQHTCL